MHLYNAWLPPPVLEETRREKEAFAGVVKSLKSSYSTDDPESVYGTLKFVAIIDLFVKAKSELSEQDVSIVVQAGLELFSMSSNQLHAQVRWGSILVKLFHKYSKILSLEVQWRPLYDILVQVHYARDSGPEGLAMRQKHFETIVSLVRSCRRFFPAGSASEIWSKLRSLMGNPWHNASFRGAEFLRLFLPTNSENEDFFNIGWMQDCLHLWNLIPNCQFWNNQWAFLTARVIRSYDSLDWEEFVPYLFHIYINMFEVPVVNVSGSYPFSTDVPSNMTSLFGNQSLTPSKAIAQSIVYLLKPGGSAQIHFQKLVNLLEQYYYPSNDGCWTYSLERFLFHLVDAFQKRLQHEEMHINVSEQPKRFLTKDDRASFVINVLRLIDRGQYSKNEHLSETAAAVTSTLLYVEPQLVLPTLTSNFHMALETMTSTHQLKSALTTIAFSGRSLLFSSLSALPNNSTGANGADLLKVSLSNALVGLDANDPDKTLATMLLVGSLFSSISTLDDNIDGGSVIPSLCWSEWLDEFLYRLFSLIQLLEPNDVLSEALNSSATSGTFLVKGGTYSKMLVILLGRLSDSLYKQALKKVTKFVTSNILLGVVIEVGILCAACVHSNPQDAVDQLVKPILHSVISSLKEAATTVSSPSKAEEPTLSLALETAIVYQLKVISVAISSGGPALLPCRERFKEVIASAFNSTSSKVNEAGGHVLRSLLSSLVHYYPIDQNKCASRHFHAALLEEWIDTKSFSSDMPGVVPKWHIPVQNEIDLANELLEMHFKSALDDLLKICESEINPGGVKNHLKVTLLRVNSSLLGVVSCLPDLRPSVNGILQDEGPALFLIAGSKGSSVGTSELRERAADVIHKTCRYLLEKDSCDIILLQLVIRIIDKIGNYGSSEYKECQMWPFKFNCPAFVEPPVNFAVPSHSRGKRRPRRALMDKVYINHIWRSSQSSYHLFHTNPDMLLLPSYHVSQLMNDLVKLSLLGDKGVRGAAAECFLKMMKRWPSEIATYVSSFAATLKNVKCPVYEVLGSCAVLSSQTILKHLTVDSRALISFIRGVLYGFDHESPKARQAIREAFVNFDNYFAGVPRSFFATSGSPVDKSEFAALIAEITSLSFERTSSYCWSDRIILLLFVASRSPITHKIAGLFLENLKSSEPRHRMLAVSALNMLLKESPYKLSAVKGSGDLQGETKSSFEKALTTVFKEKGFLEQALNALSIFCINDAAVLKKRSSMWQSTVAKKKNCLYFDFSASWPRTPNLIPLFGVGPFRPDRARMFKRLIQQCGIRVLLDLRNKLEEFMQAKDRSKQCIAAEVFAGVLHSDVIGVSEEWDDWMMVLLRNIIQSPTLDIPPEWVASVRYAVTGKGKSGTRAPLMRCKVLECLMEPLPQPASTFLVAKRYTFLSAALVELFPRGLTRQELDVHDKLLTELHDNMSHSSVHVRESIGETLSVVCTNLVAYVDEGASDSEWEEYSKRTISSGHYLVKQASKQLKSRVYCQDDAYWLETFFYFTISSLRSGRHVIIQDRIAEILEHVVPFTVQPNVTRCAFELLKWTVFDIENSSTAVDVMFNLAENPSWRVRLAVLTYLPCFIYRHTFMLTYESSKDIKKTVKRLLKDDQLEVREQAAIVLAGLFKSWDEKKVEKFRDEAYKEALVMLTERGDRTIASVHGSILALAACVLSVPYDMPSWLPKHVTLLARFASEPAPLKASVTKIIAEFRRTHVDAWDLHKKSFTQDQLQVLEDTRSSFSYFV